MLVQNYTKLQQKRHFQPVLPVLADTDRKFWSDMLNMACHTWVQPGAAHLPQCLQVQGEAKSESTGCDNRSPHFLGPDVKVAWVFAISAPLIHAGTSTQKWTALTIFQHWSHCALFGVSPVGWQMIVICPQLVKWGLSKFYWQKGLKKWLKMAWLCACVCACMSHKGRCPWDSVDLKKGASETVLT